MKEERLEIEHDKIIDGFGHLTNHRYYLSFECWCAICACPIVLSARDQKYFLEVKRVPVKFMQKAAYCVPCRKLRARINFLQRETSHCHNLELKAELDKLCAEERDKNYEVSSSPHLRRSFDDPPWPYYF